MKLKFWHFVVAAFFDSQVYVNIPTTFKIAVVLRKELAETGLEGWGLLATGFIDASYFCMNLFILEVLILAAVFQAAKTVSRVREFL